MIITPHFGPEILSGGHGLLYLLVHNTSACVICTLIFFTVKFKNLKDKKFWEELIRLLALRKSFI
jgi:hypothetical protein